MVAPLLSYSKSITRFWPGTTTKAFSLVATGWKQKPPYINTAYSVQISYSKTAGNAWGNNTFSDENRERAKTAATNKARAKLVGELGDTSSLGATLTAERRETFGMLTSGVTSVLLSAKALRRGDVVKAARLLGVAPPVVRTVVKTVRRKGRRSLRKRSTVLVLPNGRQVSHSLASKWLWWSYGVAPLAGDIYNSVDVLQRPIPSMRIKGSGSATDKNVVNWYGTMWHFSSKAHVRMAVDVRLENPNLYLANQLGLTNPAQWALEAIMFSFVLDWFSNLSQIVNQMTDFVGLKTSDPVSSFRTQQSFDRYGPAPGFVTSKTVRIDLSRTLSIPSAKLRFAYEPFSLQRGANAVSLLVSFLKKN